MIVFFREDLKHPGFFKDASWNREGTYLQNSAEKKLVEMKKSLKMMFVDEPKCVDRLKIHFV